MKLIDILHDLARGPRTLTFDESAYIEALGLKMSELRPSSKAQLLISEGLTPDAVAQLTLDDDVAGTLTFLLRQGAH